MNARLKEIAASILKSPVISWTAANARGCTANERWVVCLKDGRSAFLKAAVDENTAKWLRREHLLYTHVSGDFMPQFLGWHEDELPVLFIEDLSACHWPPPWTNAQTEAVQTALNDLAATPVSDALQSTLPRMGDYHGGKAGLPGWKEVAANPQPFLSLQLCSAQWLGKALPVLMAASSAAKLDGESLVHNDIRSDNLCFRDGRAIFVDWNWTRIGNSLFDVAAWLPSLHSEGGPRPEDVLPHGTTEIASFMSGYWASQAGLAPFPNAPRVRPLQLQCLKSALPWAVRSLHLAPLDGTLEERI